MEEGVNRDSRGLTIFQVIAVAKKAVTPIWSVILLTGGLICLVYFAEIQYLPQLTLSQSTVMLAAIFFVGVFIVAVIGGFMLLPALYVGMSMHGKKGNANKLRQPQPKDGLLDQGSSLADESIATSTNIALALFAATMLGVTLIHLTHEVSAWWYALPLTLSFSSALVLVVANRHVVGRKSSKKLNASMILSQFFDKSMLFLIWTLTLTFASYWLIEIREIPSDPVPQWEGWFAILFFVGAVIAVNVILPRIDVQEGKRVYIFFPVVMFSLFLVSAGTRFSVPRSAFRILGLGDIEAKQLIVRPGVCKVLDKIDQIHRVKFKSDECSPKKGNGLGYTGPLMILSRLGQSMLLVDEKTHVEMVVKKSAVLAWQPKQPSDVPEQSPSRRSVGQIKGTDR